ncbi:GapS6a family protein [Marinomonas sp. PE14-40]|uniref:GapS6a family protein n=1 Tax=Marinomonas sp. PE14-40 TaxID=3060621 RepID=UPI003F67F98F
MDFLTATIFSGIVFDIIKDGVKVNIVNLKDKMTGWVVNDEAIQKLVDGLKDAGINEDLNKTAIERRVNESQALKDQLATIHPSPALIQQNKMGHNINSTNSTITIGNININSEK